MSTESSQERGIDLAKRELRAPSQWAMDLGEPDVSVRQVSYLNQEVEGPVVRAVNSQVLPNPSVPSVESSLSPLSPEVGRIDRSDTIVDAPQWNQSRIPDKPIGPIVGEQRSYRGNSSEGQKKEKHQKRPMVQIAAPALRSSIDSLRTSRSSLVGAVRQTSHSELISPSGL